MFTFHQRSVQVFEAYSFSVVNAISNVDLFPALWMTSCHSLLGRGRRVLTATGSVYGNHGFSTPPQIRLPMTDRQKLSLAISLATATQNQIWYKSAHWRGASGRIGEI